MAAEADFSTAASDALRQGRVALGRSFRFHRRRGALCGRGYCGFCEVSTGSGRVLACQVPPDPAVAARARDPLRLVGWIAEAWPPWFYERHFLRPAGARRLYLDALRRLSAAGPLGPARVRPPKRFLEEEVDVAVVGRNGNVRGHALGLYDERVLGVVREDALVAMRFERLVLATGWYERLPPIAGNDLPGILGAKALERYARGGGLRPGTRVAVWGEEARRAPIRDLLARHRAQLVWTDERAPHALLGRGRVRALAAEERVECDLFVVAVAQPAIELALQAGARAELSAGDLPILVVTESPPWLELAGSAAATGSGVPDVPAADDAFACLCEDVRVRDVRRAIAEGFAHPELVKRRTGALTGPCQGKLCAPLVLALFREAGLSAVPTTSRPPARAVSLLELAADA